MLTIVTPMLTMVTPMLTITLTLSITLMVTMGNFEFFFNNFLTGQSQVMGVGSFERGDRSRRIVL